MTGSLALPESQQEEGCGQSPERPKGQRCTRKGTHIYRHACASMHIYLVHTHTDMEEVLFLSGSSSEVSGQGRPLRAIGEGGRKGDPRLCSGPDCQGRRVVTDLPGPRLEMEPREPSTHRPQQTQSLPLDTI